MAEGLFNKFKMLIGVDDIEEEEELAMAASAAPVPVAASMGETRRIASYNNMDRANTFVQPKIEPRSDSKVVSMQQSSVRKQQQFKLVVTEPLSFDVCPKLVDNLKSKKPIIINLEKLENEKARKIFDFLSGATYALNGNVQKVANNIFIFAPENVDVLSSAEASRGSSISMTDSPWRK